MINLNNTLKTTFAVCLSVMLGTSSCNNSQKPEDSKEVAEESNEEKLDERKDEKDAQFLVDAAEINLMEIRLGQLAQTSGTMADVKSLGKMMVEEHTKAWGELKALAAKKSITIPEVLTEKGEEEYKKLSEKTGNDFDKEYCDKMVKGHKDAIDKFEDAAEDAKDPEIKAWASSMIPGLKTHLEKFEMCEEKAKKVK